jgi:hypothetical protein
MNTTTTPLAEKPKRSAIERVIVQGGIALSLIIIAMEGRAYLRVNSIQGKLTSVLEKAESGEQRFTREVADQIFEGKKPDESIVVPVAVGEERYDIYNFPGLLKNRSLCLHYTVHGKGQDEGQPDVLEVLNVVPEAVVALRK